MLPCVDANHLLARRADGDPLAPAERERLDEHLGGCSSCRNALAEQRAVADLLRARPADRVSPQFHARLSRQLDEVSGWLGLLDWRAWTLRLAPAAAALALAAFLTAEQTAAAPINLEAWAVSTTDASSAASLLWSSEVSSESVLQDMIGVEAPAAEGTSDGR